MLSIVYHTLRPGGIDLFVNSLAKQTFQDFEVVICDDWAPRNYNAVRKYFAEKGVKLAWIGKSKEKCYPDTRFNQMNAINTGLLHCSRDSEYIVSVDDFVMLRPNCMELWKKRSDSKKREAVSGTARIHEAPQPIVDSVRTFDVQYVIPQEVREWEWIPEIFEMFYFGMSTMLWEEINAIDERTDTYREYPIPHFIKQCGMNAIDIVVDHENITDMLDHRSWKGGVWYRDWWEGKIDAGFRPEVTAKSQNCFEFKERVP